MPPEPERSRFCLRCLAGEDDSSRAEPEVFELDEGTCERCGRTGAVACRMDVPSVVDGQEALFAVP